MKKKLISLILVATLAFSMTACGNSSNGDSADLKSENAELKTKIEDLEKQLKESKDKLSQYEGNVSDNTGNASSDQSKTYAIGETWTVDGLFSLTFTSAALTDDRNQYSEKNPAQVIILNFDYENIGYPKGYQDLYIGSSSFKVIDEAGEMADNYPANITTYPQETPIGAKCIGAQEAFGLNNPSSKVKIIVEIYGSNFETYSATFELQVG